MFLLNQMKNLTVKNIENKFTIQNVPIKSSATQLYLTPPYANLQYKMFLLNQNGKMNY